MQTLSQTGLTTLDQTRGITETHMNSAKNIIILQKYINVEKTVFIKGHGNRIHF